MHQHWRYNIVAMGLYFCYRGYRARGMKFKSSGCFRKKKENFNDE
jgi:hypothetical protein